MAPPSCPARGVDGVAAAASRPETGVHAVEAAAAVIGRAARTAKGDVSAGSSKSHRLQSPAASAGASGFQSSPASAASGCRRPSGPDHRETDIAGRGPEGGGGQGQCGDADEAVHRGGV